MDYNEEYSDHGVHTHSRKDNTGEEEEEESEEDYSLGDSVEVSQIKNNGSSDNVDPLTESFQNLQVALQRELEKFQELGREETLTLLHDGAESIQKRHDASPSRLLGSEKIEKMVNNVERMENKLEEAKRILEVKESQIRELKSTTHNGGTEIRIEDIFRQKMEAEIEHLVFTRSVASQKRRIKLIEEEKTLAESEAHKMLSKLGEAETKAENLKNEAQELQEYCVEIIEVKSFKKRVFKTMTCLLLQLGLLFMLFGFQLIPDSETVVPT